MAGATSIIKYISRFGITAAKNKFGTSKKSGVGQLTDEQLGQGLNKFEAKKAAIAAEKARLLEITRARREQTYGTDQSNFGKK